MYTSRMPEGSFRFKFHRLRMSAKEKRRLAPGLRPGVGGDGDGNDAA